MEDFKVVKKLGAGGQGATYMAIRNADSRSFVIKQVVCANIKEGNVALKEAKVLQVLRHKHVVKYEDVFLSETKDKTSGQSKLVVCIVMELCDKGDLMNYLIQSKKDKKLVPEPRAVKWIEEICDALAYVHQASQGDNKGKMLHRDLKPMNIFISRDDTLKVGDFGLAREVVHDRMSRVGTPCYLAPEVLNAENYGEPADIWGLGCIALEMLSLNFLWEDKGLLAVKVLSRPITVNEMSSQYSMWLRQAVVKMLDVKPENRPTAAQCLQFSQARNRSPAEARQQQQPPQPQQQHRPQAQQKPQAPAANAPQPQVSSPQPADDKKRFVPMNNPLPGHRPAPEARAGNARPDVPKATPKKPDDLKPQAPNPSAPEKEAMNDDDLRRALLDLKAQGLQGEDAVNKLMLDGKFMDRATAGGDGKGQVLQKLRALQHQGSRGDVNSELEKDYVMVESELEKNLKVSETGAAGADGPKSGSQSEVWDKSELENLFKLGTVEYEKAKKCAQEADAAPGEGKQLVNGASYKGAMVGNVCEGLGMIKRSNGEKYAGTFKANKYHGHGVVKFKDGSFYIGQFEAGRYSGFGYMKLTNGDEYLLA